ncbi:response regulator [Paraburkholderia unamae]|uniref:Response regulator n=1 Tax=Paraburkholderia unamae TaxID=219649 RepID=A0ACC6RF11_9BURK
MRTPGTGREALEVAGQFQPDMVFLGLRLHHMSGLDVATQFSARPKSGRPVLVALTGYGQPEDRERTREAGFDHHFVKPVPAEDILSPVARFKETPDPS